MCQGAVGCCLDLDTCFCGVQRNASSVRCMYSPLDTCPQITSFLTMVSHPHPCQPRDTHRLWRYRCHVAAPPVPPLRSPASRPARSCHRSQLRLATLIAGHCICRHAPSQHGREEERRQRDQAWHRRGRVHLGAPPRTQTRLRRPLCWFATAGPRVAHTPRHLVRSGARTSCHSARSPLASSSS